MKAGKLHRAVLGTACASAAFACQAAVAALPSNIPFKTATEADDSLVYRAIASFVLACLAAYGIAWYVKRYLPGIGKAAGKGKRLERLEAMRLNQRSMLMRVRWHDEELLIGENEHGIALLGRRPFEPEATADALQASAADVA
ncbi:MAG: flagellar biosynthetic protein FliO, partial [Burkholderiaceae bacterium]|nr:flagellar biosynthetic protein FliO [Burkholderiaceae bacterium]